MSQHLAQTELYTGKAKSVYATNDPESLVMLFRNDTSAFDGVKKMALENKGMVNNYFNAHIMQYLAQHGIATHFVKVLSPQESLVKKLTMLPIECVVRNFAAGSLCRRLGVEEGRELNPPTFEFFLKNDALHDPMINEAHIISLGWATEQQITEMKRLSLEVNRLLVKLFRDHGLLLADFKLEFGLFNGQLLLGDEITPDGCRIWDAETKKILDKDRFRKDLGSVVESYIEAATRLGVKLPD